MESHRISKNIYGVENVSKDFLANKDAYSFIKLIKNISNKNHFFINRKKTLNLKANDLEINSLSFNDFDRLFWKELKSFNFQIDWKNIFQRFSKTSSSKDFEDYTKFNEDGEDSEVSEKLVWFKEAESYLDGIFEDGDNAEFNNLKNISSEFCELLRSINTIEFHSNSNAHIKHIDWILHVYSEFVEKYLLEENDSKIAIDFDSIKLSRISTFAILGTILFFHNNVNYGHLHRAVLFLIESDNRDDGTLGEINQHMLEALNKSFAHEEVVSFLEVIEGEANLSLFILFWLVFTPIVASYRTEACHVLIKSLTANFSDLLEEELYLNFPDPPSASVKDITVDIIKNHKDHDHLIDYFKINSKERVIKFSGYCGKNYDELDMLVIATWLTEYTYDNDWDEVVNMCAKSLSSNRRFIDKDSNIMLYHNYKSLKYSREYFNTLNLSYINFSNIWFADYTTLEDITPLIIGLSNYGLNRFATLCFCYSLHWMDIRGNLRNIDILNLNQVYNIIAIGENKATVDSWLDYVFCEFYGFEGKRDYFLILCWIKEKLSWSDEQHGSKELFSSPRWIEILDDEVREHYLSSLERISNISHQARNMENQEIKTFFLELQVEGQVLDIFSKIESSLRAIFEDDFNLYQRESDQIYKLMEYHHIRVKQCRVQVSPDLGWFAHFLQQNNDIFDKSKRCFEEVSNLGFKGKNFFYLDKEERNKVIEVLFSMHRMRNPSSHGKKGGLPTLTIDNLSTLYQFHRRYMDTIYNYFK